MNIRIPSLVAATGRGLGLITMITALSASAQSTWTGGGTDNNWSTAANWDTAPVSPTSLTFAGNTRPVNNNDLSITANDITFDSAAGAFTLNGNSLGLAAFANITFNAEPLAPVTQTINLPLATAGDITIGTDTNGSITINGSITGGNQVTQGGTDNAGVLTLAGNNALKGLVVNNGTNIITGYTLINGIGGSSFFYVPDAGNTRSGTLIIQPGATLIVTNGFQDSGVIARDGANGRIVQNGGVFNFAINDGSHNYLFVGASGQPNAHAEYDINGGVLDMGNDTLGVALGVNAGDITGVVNQTGGVITNVLNLYFSPFFSTGNGIYNLTGGSLSIGSGGITDYPGGAYQINLGGGTVGAEVNWSSALNMTLTSSNGAVTFKPSGNTITLSGVLSGTGGLNVSGSGTLELSGANTYTGATTINAGSVLQLDVTGSSSGAIRVANGGLLNLNYTGNYVVGSFYTNGVALSVGTYNSSNLPGFITGSGNLQVASGISTGLWTGLGANNNWSTGGNWDNNAVPVFPHAVTFQGATGLNNNNDLTGITISSFTFSNNAGAFTIGGNSVNLSGNIAFSSNPASSVTQTINFGMTWNNPETLDTPANGNLTLNGNINSSVDTSLVKLDTGTLSLGGSDAIQSWDLNGGTTILTGNVTLNGGGSSRMYLGDGDALANCSGTLIIQPSATLTMSGNFADAFVIGRDSGSGHLIQNGGTFNYTANQGYLLVGATSEAGTSAEYDMNNGVLNLGGNTLGIGLGDNGIVYTATLNQTNGAINNVFKFDLGALRSFGKGVYNLSGGSITIDIGGIVSDDGSYAINLGGGTVAASSSWSSPLNMTLTGSNGPVTFNTSGNTITLSGALSGPGGLVVSGGGILELSGANSYLGDTLVSSGFLQLDTTGSSSGAFRVVNGGLFNLNFSGNYLVASLYTNGVAVGLGTYNSGNMPSFITGGGNLQVVGSVSTGHWTGLGANNNWSTAANWDDNAVPVFPIALTFGGNNQLNNNNDLTGITVAGITFSNTAGAFTIGGNAVSMNGNIGFIGNPSSTTTQTVNLNMTFSGSETVDAPANAVVSLGGNLTSSSDTSLVKLDAGGLVLGGTDSLLSWDLDGGATILTGNTTINGGGNSRIYVGDGDTVPNCNGTLVIQPGAALSIVGNYADAMVIGRDSGSGTVVQNGGTFSFNPANQTYLFVGASGNTATRSIYDMNGGVLDMNGKTLGIALGVNLLITGVVNQVSGVITNVGNLWLDSAFSTGYSIYNLTGGSLWIGSGGITTSGNGYQLNFGGGTIGAEASWSSSQNMTLTGNNGPVTFSPAGNTITLSGVLSGLGSLTVAGSGTLELSGANNYTGNTTVNGAMLKLDSTSNHSGAFQLSNGATLNLNYSGTLSVASASTNGVALAVGTYSSGNLSAFITGTGSLQVAGTLPTTPTNINVSVSGGKVTIGWPNSYQGWILQRQTNSLSVGLRTNWVDVQGSANVTSTNFPVNAAPVSFYRLRYPSP